jgi:hypothetical protein
MGFPNPNVGNINICWTEVIKMKTQTPISGYRVPISLFTNLKSPDFAKLVADMFLEQLGTVGKVL